MKSNKLNAILIPIVAVLVVLVLGANIAAGMFDSFLDHYLGGNPLEIRLAEGSENWDTNYYKGKYASKEEATKAGEEFVTKIGDEGIVLLKNNGARPLSTSEKISLIGRYAADPIYGGAGSGTVDPTTCSNFYKGISAAGFAINDTAYNWIDGNYANYPKANIVMDSPQTSAYYIGEIPFADYSADAQASLKGTTAVVVLGRGGGEGGDLSRDLLGTLNSGISENFTPNAETANYVEGQHQLELNKEELDLIAAAKANCDKVIVVLNASTTMELGPLMAGEYEVDAILAAGSIGSTAANSVGHVLAGTVNPSGRTVDTWAADFTKDPTFYNFGSNPYTDVSGYYPANEGDTAYFIEYEEGIYLGYRYYETAYVEALAGNYPGFDYDAAVVFPFGYGLSYTTFEKTLNDVKQDGDNIVATVTVKNAGAVAGKDVVELYYSAPYTKGGTEKSAVVLGAFEKTSLLAPGASETITLTYPVKAMSSWNLAKAAYVLDAGEYVISLRNNSHDVVAEKALSFGETVYATDEATGTAYSALFQDMTDYMQNYCTNLSRADFAGTFPTKPEAKTAASVGLTFEQYDPAKYADPNDTMPTTGASNGVPLIDLRGKDKDDPLWEELLDEITVDEMVAVINDGAYNTAAIASIGKPATSDPDGPQGFTSLFGTTGNCAYCSEVLMAQTWNKELMHELGNMIGEEALASGYNGWYAPAANTHRSPFAGRNFEYYSEDGTLAGYMMAETVSGAADKGCYGYIKHFCMNDMETTRTAHICTWANEQAVREIYLKPFELCVKNAKTTLKYLENGVLKEKEFPGCTAVMSSFNYVGAVWAGGRESLMTGILRNEWGFKGFAITDFNLYSYMHKNQGIAAGTDHMLTYSAWSGPIADTTSATAVKNLRKSMHNILFTVVNSNAMNKVAPGSKFIYHPATWQILLWIGSAVLCLVAAFLVFLMIRRKLKEKKA
ncbi:MAG: glycoside hydrolase family 3 C-terminal domain-containing protein [Clostridia bacterium]|nr:glycoside hydrolase family 3 C-terminal domain-containing protein [Clostridia bacterium]